ncbi:MAG TPA: hypothetical protein VEK08_05810 [Planctomycetota bacterium]|nr:hypothetical protein [Planctomycetota bacterium]
MQDERIGAGFDGAATADTATGSLPRTEITEAGGTPAVPADKGGRGTRALQKKIPRWQQISGLTPDAEEAMSRKERRAAIRKLFNEFQRLLREALAEHDADPDCAERSYLWDPIDMLCGELGIARRKLSALCRELSGMAAHEVLDRLRAEKVEAQLREELKAHARKIRGAPGACPGWTLEKARCLKWEFYRRRQALKRGDPFWAPEAESARRGFRNFARYRRACQLRYGKTPQELELSICAEMAEYYEHAEELAYRVRYLAEPERHPRLRVYGELPFNDLWAQALREDPQWLHRQREVYGLAEDLHEQAERLE